MFPLLVVPGGAPQVPGSEEPFIDVEAIRTEGLDAAIALADRLGALSPKTPPGAPRHPACALVFHRCGVCLRTSGVSTPEGALLLNTAHITRALRAALKQNDLPGMVAALERARDCELSAVVQQELATVRCAWVTHRIANRLPVRVPCFCQCSMWRVCICLCFPVTGCSDVDGQP